MSDEKKAEFVAGKINLIMKMNEAAALLAIHGALTNAERWKVYRRLMKMKAKIERGEAS